MGSSPRVRGAARRRQPRWRCGGIIPARAGSSSRTRRTPSSGRDHPRACGEQSMAVVQAAVDDGSSPRVRGAADRPPRQRVPHRIIPARAGSSLCRYSPRRCIWDHPRACGEQSRVQPWTDDGRGSSPRVRGAAEYEYYISDCSRIIPARAGSSMPHSVTLRGMKDHPRACGEQNLRKRQCH